MAQTPMARRRRAAAAAAANNQARTPAPKTRGKQPPVPQRRRRKPIPTVDLHIRVALEDVLIRISAADYQKLVVYWKLGAEDVILRGPYNNMETDIILRGTEGGMVSVRPHQKGRTQLPAFKLVRASEAREEILAQAGL